MKKDKEIWLDPEEIQQLLEGGLYWEDIEPKLSPENADSYKRHIAVTEAPGLEEMVKTTAAAEENAPEQDVRAILLGENPLREEENARAQAPASFQEGSETKLYSSDEPALQEALTGQDSSVFSKSTITEPISPTTDNELKQIILSDAEEEEEEQRTPFGGLKLVLLLLVVAALTFGFWFYFLNR